MKLQAKSAIEIKRSESGVPVLLCDNEEDMYWGLGYCHAMDRGMQMMLMKILGTGTASEHLDGSEEMLGIDKFFRRVNWTSQGKEIVNTLPEEDKVLLEAYCHGVNHYFSKKQPWELKNLLGFKDFNWQPEDVLLLTRMVGYLTLAQSQGEIEHFFIELVQKGVSREKLKELFPGIIGEYDEELLKKIVLTDKIVPDSVKWNSIVNPMMASNNWVISPDKSASGAAILANDPHLELNRIPPIWYEIIIKMGEKSFVSATMPGVGALTVGRNNHISWGATYTFMDACDYWIEECKDGKYKKDGKWLDFNQRNETIKRKKGGTVEIIYYENDHGVLLGDPSNDGYYLSFLWSGNVAGKQSLHNAIKIARAENVKEGMECLGKYEVSFNWVIADDQGNIGYQMSGLFPKRSEGLSGFSPIPGWDSKNDWQGFYPHTDLPLDYNPKDGFFVTANNNLNRFGKVAPINMPMENYRAERIAQLLREKDKISVDDIKEMHMDVYSLQAEKFMPLLRPLLGDSEKGQILRDWDLCYDPDSLGASLFEQVYRSLYFEVFGSTMGREWVSFLRNETGVFVDFYGIYDRILLSENSAWFEGKTRKELYENAIKRAFAEDAKIWGEENQITMTNIILGGKLPGFLGFDKGPFPLRGGRATIHQGQIYRSAGRQTSFSPGFRMIADMSEKGLHTNSCGGVSDRRFSKLYFNDFENWFNGVYKYLTD